MLMMLKMYCDDVMLRMYMGGAMTLLDIPGGGNRVVKEFKHL